MITPQILNLKSKGDLRKISSKFSGLVGQQQIGQTLIIVDSSDNVLTSRDVGKILKKFRFRENVTLTFVTTNVTIEAGQLLKERNIYLLQTKDVFWTDNDFSQRKEDTHRFLDKMHQQIHDVKLKSLDE